MTSWVPYTVHDKQMMYTDVPMKAKRTLVHKGEGIPGIFITLSREQAKAVYPIPEEIKVWFGDSYLYPLLDASGYSISISHDLLAFHHTSMSI
jgi:hypothetical protein